MSAIEITSRIRQLLLKPDFFSIESAFDLLRTLDNDELNDWVSKGISLSKEGVVRWSSDCFVSQCPEALQPSAAFLAADYIGLLDCENHTLNIENCTALRGIPDISGMTGLEKIILPYTLLDSLEPLYTSLFSRGIGVKDIHCECEFSAQSFQVYKRYNVTGCNSVFTEWNQEHSGYVSFEIQRRDSLSSDLLQLARQGERLHLITSFSSTEDDKSAGALEHNGKSMLCLRLKGGEERFVYVVDYCILDSNLKEWSIYCDDDHELEQLEAKVNGAGLSFCEGFFEKGWYQHASAIDISHLFESVTFERIVISWAQNEIVPDNPVEEVSEVEAIEDLSPLENSQRLLEALMDGDFLEVQPGAQIQLAHGTLVILEQSPDPIGCAHQLGQWLLDQPQVIDLYMDDSRLAAFLETW
jgi:hypothetical protein